MKDKTTTQAKHTPGPWRIEDVRTQSISIGTVRHHHVNSMDAMTGADMSGRRSDLIARVMTGPGLSEGDPQANARLIAQAPALLETSKALNQALFDVRFETELPPSVVTAILNMRAAIARAEGR